MRDNHGIAWTHRIDRMGAFDIRLEFAEAPSAHTISDRAASEFPSYSPVPVLRAGSVQNATKRVRTNQVDIIVRARATTCRDETGQPAETLSGASARCDGRERLFNRL